MQLGNAGNKVQAGTSTDIGPLQTTQTALKRKGSTQGSKRHGILQHMLDMPLEIFTEPLQPKEPMVAHLYNLFSI